MSPKPDVAEITMPDVPEAGYRDLEDFNGAMDRAVERRRESNAVYARLVSGWWALVAAQAALYGADTLLDLDVRHAIPGVDLVKPLWIIIIAALIGHHVLTRRAHRGIIARRLCLDCATPLLAVPVDDDERGRCPSCGRGFGLWEYRRPNENVGPHFRGYYDRRHFDATMSAAASRIHASRGFGLEGALLGWGWTAVGAAYATLLLFGVALFDWIPFVGEHPYAIWAALMGLWSAWYAWRMRRLRRTIVESRRCLACGFALRATPLDAHGVGRCPECAEPFSDRQYTRPPKDGSPDEA